MLMDDYTDHIKVFKALSNETRFKILKEIEKEPLILNEISKNLHIRNPTTLQHLRVLEKAKLIRSFNERGKGNREYKKYRLAEFLVVVGMIKGKINILTDSSSIIKAIDDYRKLKDEMEEKAKETIEALITSRGRSSPSIEKMKKALINTRKGLKEK